jgi:lactoylglutathione lyase
MPRPSIIAALSVYNAFWKLNFHDFLPGVFMANVKLSVDHIHLVSPDPEGTASWYADKFGAEIVKRSNARGAQQVAVSFGDFLVIVRGERPDEKAADKDKLLWGVDHFGLGVPGDFDGFCDSLKKRNVDFSMDPANINPTTRIAFIKAPDGVSVELVSRNT